MKFEAFQQLPKAECHVHLEGSMPIERVLALAAHHPNHPWCGLDAATLRARFRTNNFNAFLDHFIAGYRLLRKARDFQVVTEDLLARFEEQGIVAAHVLYSPGIYTQKLGVTLKDIHDGIEAGLAQAPKLKVRLVLDTVLNMGFEFMQTTLNHVLADRRAFLGGFSVGGGDPELSMTEFVPLFEQASRAGLFCVAHAGEVDGPENIDILLRDTDLRRIAHGCNAVLSETTMASLERRGIIIDICPTSNLRTGTVPTLDAHPLRTFFARGIRMTLNTDDPLYFDTTLHEEYQQAAGLPEVDETVLRQMAQTSLQAIEEAE